MNNVDNSNNGNYAHNCYIDLQNNTYKMYNAYNTKLVKKYSYFYFSCEVNPTHWTRTQVNKTNARCADR